MDKVKAVAKIAEYQSQIAELEEAVANIKHKLAEDLGEGEEIVGDNEGGYTKVIVYRHKVFNENYGKSQRPDLWDKAKRTKEYVDSASAKAALSPEEYALFQKPSLDLSVKLETVHD